MGGRVDVACRLLLAAKETDLNRKQKLKSGLSHPYGRLMKHQNIRVTAWKSIKTSHKVSKHPCNCLVILVMHQNKSKNIKIRCKRLVLHQNTSQNIKTCHKTCHKTSKHHQSRLLLATSDTFLVVWERQRVSE